MESIVKADIFFVISTLAVVIITIASAVALIYLIGVLRNIMKISRRVRGAADELADDLHWARSGFRKHIFALFTFLWRFVKVSSKDASGAPKNKKTNKRKRSTTINKQ